MGTKKMVQQRPSRLSRVPPALQPAVRAYLLGYLLDILPTILKQLLRYTLANIKRLNKVRRRIYEEKQIKSNPSIAQLDQSSSASSTSIFSDAFLPALQQIPTLLQHIAKSMVAALGPRGVALACALALTGSALLENVFLTILIRPNTLRLQRESRAVLSTFASAAACSGLALHFLQYSAYGMNNSGNESQQFMKGFYNPFRRKVANANPTPLAPGGHFLARLTSLSIPATPKGSGSRSPMEKSPSARSITNPPQSPTEERTSSTPTTDAKGKKRKALGTASPTIDLTLFALVRAMDTLVRAIPAMRRRPKSRALGPQGGMKTDNSRNELARLSRFVNRGAHIKVVDILLAAVQNQAEGLVFVVACAIIMYNWFYAPERLPPTYVKWITNLASMDERLLVALRSLRTNKPHDWHYGGKEITPAAVDLIGSLSESLGYPYGWGDPSQLPASRVHALAQKRSAQSSKTDFLLQDAAGLRGRGEMGGLPCEIVHCGVGGSNCYKNALYRFLRAYRVCLGIYIPVHLLPRLIFGRAQFKRQPVATLLKVLKGSMRSATFLSSFIASIWFMVCLSRTTLFPRLFPHISHQVWDGGFGPILGSWTCGWSVFIEEKRKRAEMALYVAPRALFALGEMAKPGWLSKGQQSALLTERILFGLSVGVVVSAAKHRPDLLRGITALMAWVVPSPRGKAAQRLAARS
ncbi:hypothetical protein CBS101457_002261 [Exobasidium rhododendri]|nr:hypothetical protein CBS101457_002261 [Exobasidium rhododendri]